MAFLPLDPQNPVGARPPEKLRPWHERLGDFWIVNPGLTQGALAAHFGKTQAWVSIVVNCDAFKEYVQKRKEEILDPVMLASVDESFRAVAQRASQKLLERIELGAVSEKTLVDAMKVAGQGLGMGSAKTPTFQQNLYVVPIPAKPKTSEEWAQVVDAETKVVSNGG
jgi:hypothetical protein